MRRFIALARVAALETLSEPLTAVLFLVAAILVHLLPAFHFHAFGEAGRLARECGLSLLLTFGLLSSASAAGHVIGRELSGGTAAVVLARDVSRGMFLIAKTVGIISAFALFAVTVSFATELAVASSVIGGIIADNTGSAVRVWGGGFILGFGFPLIAFVIAAVANRFFGCRFCLGLSVAIFLSQAAALVLAWSAVTSKVVGIAFASATSIAFAFAALFVGCSVFITLAAALAVRLKPAALAAAVSLAVILSFLSDSLPSVCSLVVPAMRNFWLADMLSNGGTIPLAVLGQSVAEGVMLIALWMLTGCIALSDRDMA